MLFNKKKPAKEPHQAKINAEILGEHFASIRTAAVEIRDFKEKKYYPTPTHAVHKPVVLDAAWESSHELFIRIFSQLNDVALRFEIEPGCFYQDCGFSTAVDAFVETLDRITYGIADALGTGRYSQTDLKGIDGRIMLIQTEIIQLCKHVTETFEYPIQSVRASIKKEEDNPED